CSQSAPSRRTWAVVSSERAFTTDEPTPCRPPENWYCPEENLPPACSVVSTSSSADFLNCFLMSTGMPRPLSTTVADLPSACNVTSILVPKPLITSSTELSTISH